MTTIRSLPITLVLLALPALASAQGRAIVLDLEGPGAGAVRGEVVQTIEQNGGSVADRGEVERAATRLGVDPGSREVAAEVGASAVLDGRVTKRGRRSTLRLTVRDASTGSTLADETFQGRGVPGLRSEIRSQLWDRVGFAIAQGRVPAVVDTVSSRSGSGSRAARPSPEDVAARDEREEEDARVAAAPAEGALSPLWLAVGASVFSRDLAYTDDLYFALRPYHLPAGFAARAAARWYPAAHVTQDFVANLGVDVQIGGALGLRTRQSDGTLYPTESLGLRAGADLRIPLAPVELGVGLGYGIHTFALGAAEGGNVASLPDVEYQFVRPAVRARADLGAGIFVEADFGWRVLTSTGELAAWFPRSSGSGLDLGAYLGWESDLGIGARAGFEMQRYFFSMNPEPGDANVAGGAADQFLAGSVDVIWRVR